MKMQEKIRKRPPGPEGCWLHRSPGPPSGQHTSREPGPRRSCSATDERQTAIRSSGAGLATLCLRAPSPPGGPHPQQRAVTGSRVHPRQYPPIIPTERRGAAAVAPARRRLLPLRRGLLAADVEGQAGPHRPATRRRRL